MISSNSSEARCDSPIGAWFKSSRSKPNGNECVEVSFGANLVYIRDSKDGDAGPVLSVPAGHWVQFLDEAAGRAPVGSNTVIQIVFEADDGVSLSARSDLDKTLSYTPGEWSAFIAGIRNAEFDLPGTDVAAA